VTGNQHHKTLIKARKSSMREWFARFGKGLGARFTGQIGLLSEMGKNAFNSVGTPALKSEITVTSITGKLNTCWQMNAAD